METSNFYILLTIVVLAIVMIVLIWTRKRMGRPLSKLATVAFLFVFAGIAFGDDRLIGYSLIGAGVLLAIIDMIKKRKAQKTNIQNG